MISLDLNMTSLEFISTIQDEVRTGRMTAEDGSWLIELRRLVVWKRQPLLVRVVRRLLGEHP